MPYLAASAQRKNETFTQLKPLAVELSQTIAGLQGTRPNLLLIETRLDALNNGLSSLIKADAYLDAKLADYVFFPISQILKHSKQVSTRCLEVALAITAILVQHGWSEAISDQLASQLMIFCILLASSKSSSDIVTSPELQCSALTCLQQLLAVQTTSSIAASTNDVDVPQLGQLVTVILDAHFNDSPHVQLAGCTTLTAFLNSNVPTKLLLSFLPGIVSALVKVLTVKSGPRKRPQQLVASLDNFGIVLRRVSADSGIPGEKSSSSISSEDVTIECAAPQIRNAVEKVARLLEHDRVDVRIGLARFCTTILRDCRNALSTSIDVAIETLLVLSDDACPESVRFDLILLMTTIPSLLAAVQSCLYTWIQATVRLMQSSDEQLKVKHLRKMHAAYQYLNEAGSSMVKIDQLMAAMLKDCVAMTLGGSSRAAISVQPSVTALQLPSIAQTTDTPRDFSRLGSNTAQWTMLDAVQKFVTAIPTHNGDNVVLDQLSSSLRTSQDNNLIANFWLILCRLRHSLQQTEDIQDMIVLEDNAPLDQIEAVYEYGLSYLNTPIADQRSEMTCLALQALCLRAQYVGEEFRIELIDALYPVLQALATPQELVQHDSLVTLNVFTRACGYDSVKELILDNVDYLTNAVSLKLNAFDISPQAPQILLMMVRLAGPSLVPYLEDIIDSIFAALEDYHAYPLLVELLFKTLSVIADEGSKNPLLDAREAKQLLQLTGLSENWQSTGISDLAQLIDERGEPLSAGTTPRQQEQALQQPWTTEDTVEDVQTMSGDDAPPPAPKTYAIVIKIADLTQHFLPSASPALRISLLSLLRGTIPAISRHENTFLPLINTLWPEIVSRLTDEEASIQAATLEVIAAICEHAREFMRGRIIELWPHLRATWRQIADDIPNKIDSGKDRSARSGDVLLRLDRSTEQALQRMKTGSAGYSSTSIRNIWRMLMSLLVVIVQTIPLPPELFDEALHMVRSELQDVAVRSAFEAVNSDAVWLMLFEMGTVPIWQPPVDMGFVDLQST